MRSPQPMPRGYSRAQQSVRWWVIPGTILLAILLDSIPYPDGLRFAEPHWVSLILFYWCITIPERIGVGTGWIVGFLLDLMHHTPFGVYALMMAFVAMVGVTLHHKVRFYSLWKQSIAIFFLSSVQVLFLIWVLSLTHNAEFRLIYWLAAVVSALVWPVLHAMLQLLTNYSKLVQGR